MKTLIENYGLHKSEDDDVLWLIQQGTVHNALGLPKESCPFKMRCNLTLCLHDISFAGLNKVTTDDYDLFCKLINRFKIVKFFDPALAPSHKILYVETDKVEDYSALTTLQLLFSPTLPLSSHLGAFINSVNIVLKRLNCSNLASFVLYDVTMEHYKVLKQIIAGVTLRTPGRLILAGPPLGMDLSSYPQLDVVKFDSRITDSLKKFSKDQLQTIGALRVREAMLQQHL